ncbi:hypothetical protein ABZ351_09965 [Streptomyces microflavus]|uniref:hypothetical protein n=1 Tax=Streptomyces TaxID=1883 RepID=UPI00211AE5E9|nr:hypothetical protein [Streptomyces sp. 2R]
MHPVFGRTGRRSAVTVLAAVVLWGPTGQDTAVADSRHPVIETLPEQEVRAAVAAARMPVAVNLARSNLGIPAGEAATLRVGERGTVVHHLDPAFAGRGGRLPLAVPGYVAVTAHADDGRAVTLQIARVTPAGGGAPRWAAVAAAQDATEADLARRLEADEVLYENQGPRGREWYALDDRALRPLSGGRGQSDSPGPLTIANYTKALRERAVPAGPPPAPAAADRSHGSGDRAWFLVGVGTLAAAGGSAALRYRRGRTDRHHG